MRLVVVAAACLLAVPVSAGVPGLALATATESPVTTQPLAPGEVLLEVNALGSSRTRADQVNFLVTVQGHGANAIIAQRQAETAMMRVVAAALAAGVAQVDIVRRPPNDDERTTALAVADMMRASDAARRGQRLPVSPPTDEEPRDTSASLSSEIRVRDADRFTALRPILLAAGAQMIGEPVYSLSDTRAARASARAQALANAHADAEAYAAALGLRIVRIVRVTDRVGLDLLGTMMGEDSRMRRMAMGLQRNDPEIETNVALGMDFALAPR